MAKANKFVILVHLVDCKTREPYIRYVTGVKRSNWVAELGKPAMEFNASMAREIATGCAMNFTRADVIMKFDWFEFKNPTKEEVDQGLELNF